jgi:hypothetical protein
MRCSKTNSIATHSLARVSACASEFKLDISQKEARSEIETLKYLAHYHQLAELEETTNGMLHAFQ